MLNKIHYNITEYLKEFNSDYRFKIILSTTSGGPVMNADRRWTSRKSFWKD